MGRIASFLAVGEQPWARLMVRSVKRHTGYPVVQMSDEDTREVPGVDAVVRIPREGMGLMSYRLLHLADFAHEEMLILDADVIMKASVDDVWERAFDVALCQREPGRVLYRDEDIAPLMPFNTGVMFSRSNAFWKHCSVWLEEQTPDKKVWWGDQLAVAAMAPKFHTLVLPSKEFNWTPDSADQESAARAYHYKGLRKAWIRP